jgi:hypothetical protein
MPHGDHDASLRDRRFGPDGCRRAGGRSGVRRRARGRTDDFVQVGSDGRVTTRADEIAWVAANPWRPRDFAYSIARIDCPAPDVAVVIGTGRSVRSVEGGAVVHSYASSNLFVRDRGRWRAALSHLSGERSEPLPR